MPEQSRDEKEMVKATVETTRTMKRLNFVGGKAWAKEERPMQMYIQTKNNNSDKEDISSFISNRKLVKVEVHSQTTVLKHQER